MIINNEIPVIIVYSDYATIMLCKVLSFLNFEFAQYVYSWFTENTRCAVYTDGILWLWFTFLAW